MNTYVRYYWLYEDHMYYQYTDIYIYSHSGHNGYERVRNNIKGTKISAEVPRFYSISYLNHFGCLKYAKIGDSEYLTISDFDDFSLWLKILLLLVLPKWPSSSDWRERLRSSDRFNLFISIDNSKKLPGWLIS